MAKTALFQSRQSQRVALPVLIFLYLVVQIPAAKALFQHGKGLTTDDAMRLVQVRDLLAGQGWYDLFQHRVLPPDGLSMHWSRYIDAPMAAIMAALQPFADSDLTARILATIWPLTLGILFLLMTAHVTRRLYGGQAALLALLVITGYELLSGAGFRIGATDHHAVQVILMLGLFGSLVLPDRPLAHGIIGGLCAALSLAVGLEMILFIGLAGIVLVAAHILRQSGANARVLGFTATLAAASPVLMAGQLAPSLWAVPVCDALSPPLLGVTTAAFLCSAVLVLGGRYLHGTAARLALTATTGAIAALVLLPMIQPCLAGPYTTMSPEDQRTLLGRIQEIRPAWFYLTNETGAAIALILPLYLTTLAMAVYVTANRGKGFVLFSFLAMAAVLSFWQFRMLTMGLPVVAIAFGASCAWMFNQGRTALRIGGLAVMMGVLLSKPLGVAYVAATWAGPGPAKLATALGDHCNDIDQMSALNAAPAGVIFNPINFGPIILLASHHSVTSAPYHRSADAFANGMLPFEKDEAALRDAVVRTRSDYVLVCNGDTYGPKESIGTQLSHGGTLPWLTKVPMDGTNLVLLKVTE